MKKNEAIEVESLDSIGFLVGCAITASVQEEDTPLFLYKYAGKSLEDIIDSNIRNYVESEFTEQFGKLDLEECKQEKTRIAQETSEEMVEHFKNYGITIDNFGLASGLNFLDQEIQQAINDAYKAEMDIKKASMEIQAQENRNEIIISKAVAERKAVEEFEKTIDAQSAKIRLEIEKILAEKWNGLVPTNVVPGDSKFLFGFRNNLID